jgi:hypothetical protein
MKPYRKYSDRALIPILKDIIEALESNDMYLEDMGDVDNNFDELSEIITDELTSYLSNVEFEDVTYFMALIIMNDDFEPPLKRPELKTYRITHTYQRVETINYKYQTDMTSFIPLDDSILGELQSSGEYEPWDGDLIDEDNVDSDYSNDWIDDIEEI